MADPVLQLLTALILLLAPFLLLKLEGVTSAKRVRRSLSLDNFYPRRTIVLAGSMLAQLLFAMLAVGLLLALLGVTDSWKVAQLVRSQGLPVLLLAVTLVPIAEELFFRGYLQKKTGVILASIVFAALHYGYGSIAEIAGAFVASLILGYGLRKANDLHACILAHACYNALSIWVSFAL